VVSGYVLNPDSVGDPDQTPRVQLLTTRSRHRARHPYVADPDVPADHKGRRPCATCGLLPDNDLHQLPPTDPAVTEAEARRLGETEQESTNP
jgi:hypothetical protein